MHVLMLGWEFPPFITGGLGTACHGLTKALDRRGIKVTFVLPQAIEGEHSEHVTLLAPRKITAEGVSQQEAEEVEWVTVVERGEPIRRRRCATQREKGIRFLGIATPLVHPYQREAGEGPVGRWQGVLTERERTTETIETAEGEARKVVVETSVAHGAGGQVPDYSHNLLDQVARYARFCVAATRGLGFDVIHAHDWMTYPAGLWIARASGKPLVVHVHSTEFDRSGMAVNPLIYDLERRGMHGAMTVVAVSQLTKGVVVRRYGVPDRKVEVVYNGVDLEPSKVGITGIRSKDKIVLYFGRITFQKGPEYFIAAAKRVLEVMDNVKFVVAGSGDMASRMIEMAAELGIGHKVLFTGFLRGNDIKRVFNLADLYVMPSVSEPFGIAPLEAMGHDVPALISKTSGVSEVLTHALKVDFWNIDDMADKIIAVLRHPPLSHELRRHGAFEARRLTWDGAALRCEQIYQRAIRGMTRVDHPPVGAS